MRIYWTLKLIPELAALPSAERRRTWRACFWNFALQWPECLTLLIGPMFAVAGCAVGDWLFPTRLSVLWTSEGPEFIRGSRIPFYLCAAAGGGIGGAIYQHTVNHYIRPMLRAYLNGLEETPEVPPIDSGSS